MIFALTTNTLSITPQIWSLRLIIQYIYSNFRVRGRHGHDRMVVGFTTTYAISAYHH